MFDLQSTDGSVRKKKYESPIPASKDGEPKPVPPNKLDRADMVGLHHRLLDLYTRERDRQNMNRADMARDADFYDNIQWDEADAQVVKDRGQMPIVYNVISASVDWVTGTEKRARTDFKILPRRKEEGRPAERKTQLLKYLSDVNRTEFHKSRAFEDAVKVGLGWLEDGIQEEDEEEPLYSRYESWRNMLHDSAANELDLSDGRYIFRSKWVDYDIACAMFPKRKGTIDAAAQDSEDFIGLDQYGDDAMDSVEAHLEQRGESQASDRVSGHQRRRVRLIEAWIRLPVQAEKVKGGTWSGELYDPSSPGHAEEVESGRAEKRERMVMRMHVCIFTTAGMLWCSPSPYRHNKFPFTPIWGYRRDRDGMPYGIIRRLRDIQTDINKRASKALHILSTNKIVMDEEALPEGMTIEEMQEEAARPDAFIVKRKAGEFTMSADRDLAQWHVEMMSRSIAMIQQASGVTDELMGRRTNATSGIAIQRRQDQGSMQTAKLFDHLLLASQVRGEKQLANVEQFMTEEKAFRITNMRGQPEYVQINDGLPENDIVRSKADFIISESAWHSSIRQAAAEELMDLLGKLASVSPQTVIVMLDLVVESLDLPNREELVKRIRSVTGMRDPDAEEPTEEEIAAAEKQAAAEQMQNEAAMAQIAKLKGEAAEKMARAGEIESRMAKTNIDAQKGALEAAEHAIRVPAVTHVGDKILHEAGFVSRSEREQAMQQQAQAQAEQQAAIAAQPGIGIDQQQTQLN